MKQITLIILEDFPFTFFVWTMMSKDFNSSELKSTTTEINTFDSRSHSVSSINLLQRSAIKLQLTSGSAVGFFGEVDQWSVYEAAVHT
jgi:hypothetical protein